MRHLERFVFLAALALLCACGGCGSSGTTAVFPHANAGGSVASSTLGVQLGTQPTIAALPIVSQISGTLLFPAVATDTTISLSASAIAPENAGLQSVRHAQSGTLTVYEYFTIVSPVTLTLPAIPAVVLRFPPSTPLAGTSMFYGIS
jgi:hypothetical protein